MPTVTIFPRKLRSGKKTWVLQVTTAEGRIYTRHLGNIPKTARDKIKQKVKTDLILGTFGLSQTPDHHTIKDAGAEYLQYLTADHAPSTVATTRQAINMLCEHFGENTDLRELDSRKVEQWLRSIPRSPARANAIFRHAKAFFSKCHAWGYTETNPFMGVKQLRTAKKLPKVIPLDHIRLFFAIIKDRRDKAYFLTLYYTGARATETYMLTWDDVDLEGLTITFRNTESQRTKSRKDRVIAIPKNLATILEELPVTGDRLFPQFRSDDRPSKVMHRYCKAAGLPAKYTPHWLRHTFITHLASTGKQALAKDIVGHSSLTVTDIYSHLTIEHQREAINNVPDPLDLGTSRHKN